MRIMRAVLFIQLFILLCSGPSSAQIVFTQIPSKLQMFPREADNYGRFKVAGTVYKSVVLRSVLLESSTRLEVESYAKQLEAGDTFTFNHKILAQLKELDLEIYASENGQKEYLLKSVKNLLAGDFYIVAGQSNAECPWDSGGRAYDHLHHHPCIRTIGTNFSWATELAADSLAQKYPVEADCMFARPRSVPYADVDSGFSGIWPIKIQSELARSTGIPNCFLNGSLGGSSIYQNFASHTPSLPDSLQDSPGPYNHPLARPYDRIFKKLSTNNSCSGVKGIFWYQGETDGIYSLDSSENYGKRFKILYKSWKADYPNVEKIFVLQINLGCASIHHDIIREVQRKLPEHYSDVVVMSTVGSQLSDRVPDMCHYTISGYEKIADKLIPLVEKYIYHFSHSEENILPPNIRKCFYVRADQICLEFDKNVVIQDSCVYPLPFAGTAYLKDYFYDENYLPLKLSSVFTEDGKLYLNLLSSETGVEKISYLPKSFSKVPSLYSGPWILSEKNQKLGAFSFDHFPVQQPVFIQKFVAPELHIYPNPTSRYVELRDIAAEECTVRLTSLFGEILWEKKLKDRNFLLDLEPQNNGIFFVEVSTISGTSRKKIILEK